MSENDALIEALDRLLEPLVQILVRNGVPHAAFGEIAKRAYVRVAEREKGIDGRKQTVSRMSVLTGLTRKEISRAELLTVVGSGWLAIGNDDTDALVCLVGSEGGTRGGLTAVR